MSKSPSLRRIQADIRELSLDPSDQYHAAPLENDMFVWHFTIRGAAQTDFEGGIYHGKILLPAEYPFKPPNIMFTTPTGRFEINTKLCLSFSAFHPELWQPAWGIRLILEALISFLPTKGDGAIGALDWTSEERKRLAKESWNYNCPICGNCKLIMDRVSERVQKRKKGGGEQKSRFQKEIEQLHALHAAAEGVDKEKENDEKDDGVNSEEVVGEEHHDDIEHDQKIKETEKTKAGENDTEHIDPPSLKNNDDINVESPFKSEEETLEPEHNNQNTVSDERGEPNTTGITGGQQQQEEVIVPESPLLSDPVVHSGIVIFSIIVYLLICKLQDIVSDMKEVEAKFNIPY